MLRLIAHYDIISFFERLSPGLVTCMRALIGLKNKLSGLGLRQRAWAAPRRCSLGLGSGMGFTKRAQAGRRP